MSAAIHISCHSHHSRVVVNFEQLEWHRSGENEACRMSKGQKSQLLADPTEKTSRTAESSLGLAKDLGEEAAIAGAA